MSIELNQTVMFESPQTSDRRKLSPLTKFAQTTALILAVGPVAFFLLLSPDTVPIESGRLVYQSILGGSVFAAAVNSLALLRAGRDFRRSYRQALRERKTEGHWKDLIDEATNLLPQWQRNYFRVLILSVSFMALAASSSLIFTIADLYGKIHFAITFESLVLGFVFLIVAVELHSRTQMLIWG